MSLPNVGNQLPSAFSSFLLAKAINVPIGVLGDVLINGLTPTLPVNASQFVVDRIVVCNPLVNGVSGSVSAGALGIFTGPGATGTAIASNQALTPTQTLGAASAQNLALNAAGTFSYAGGGLYANVGTAVAGATVTILIYGTVLNP